jgi:hypothetical protein
VKARYVAISKIKKDAEAVMQTIKLHEVWSTGTTRGGDDEAPVVELELSEGDDGDTEENDGDTEENDATPFNEEWWSEFDDKLADHLDDLDIED